MGHFFDWGKLGLLELRSEARLAQVRALRRTFESSEAGVLRVLGVEHAFSGTEWARDPVTGYVWPSVDAHRVRLAPHPGIDVKYVWELNCCHHLLEIALLGVLANDSKCAVVVRRQLEGWIAANPIGLGINWSNPLEMGLRLISWCAIRDLVLLAGAGDLLDWPEWRAAAVATARAVEIGLTDYRRVPNCHLIGELVALLVWARVPVDSASGVTSGKLLRSLERELEAQVDPDGFSREGSAGYHRFVLELLIAFIASDDSASPAVVRTASAMAHALDSLIGPDRRLLPWGDSDDSRVLSVGLAHVDPTNACRALADNLGLLDAAAPRASLRGLRELRSSALIDEAKLKAPAFILESCGDADAEMSLSLRIGTFGLGGAGFAAHSHDDLAGFLLYRGGRAIVTEAGGGPYQSDSVSRRFFRSANAHSSVWPLDEPMAVQGGAFWWSQVPTSRLVRRSVGEPGLREIIVDVEGRAGTVRRTILMDAHRDTVVVDTDFSSGHGTRWGWGLVFGPSVRAVLDSPTTINLLSPDGRQVASVECEGCSVSLGMMPYSQSYSSLGFVWCATGVAVGMTLRHTIRFVGLAS